MTRNDGQPRKRPYGSMKAEVLGWPKAKWVLTHGNRYLIQSVANRHGFCLFTKSISKRPLKFWAMLVEKPPLPV
jgi:hypothetical protein